MSVVVSCRCYAPVPLGRTCIVCSRPIGWEAKGKLVASYVVRSGLVTRRTREAQREDAHADD